MSIEQYYEQCNRYTGRPVRIATSDGCVHRCVIERVDRRFVYVRPIDGNRRLGGFGYGFGFGGGYGYDREPYRIALGAIAGIALLSLFFW